MKKSRVVILTAVVGLIFSSIGFADDLTIIDQPLGEKQEHLFFLEDLSLCEIDDFDYDPVNEQIYILMDTDESQTLDVYDLNGVPVAHPNHDLILGYSRKQIEFNEKKAWSIENQEDKDYLFLNNVMSSEITDVLNESVKGFRVQGNQAIYFFEDDIPFSRDYRYVTGTNNPFKLDDSILHDTSRNISGYDLSADGNEAFYLIREKIDEHREISINRVNETKNQDEISIPVYSGRYCTAGNLYTTDEHIVVSYWDENNIGHIERYTYEGDWVDGIVVNFRISKIIEGPDGSTLYIQKADPERLLPGKDDDPEDPRFSWCEDPIEMVQINWNAEEKSTLQSTRGMKPVIREQTRSGQTIARFTDSQFGLLRVEEPETGIMDYQAPIRSHENLVRLQIPYCDIKAKLESGVRNLLVNYQDQELIFSMVLFDRDDMLASMPCQSDATIEIIMHTDEAGKLTYEVQLFVVEQVNGMTKVVHRKTIQ